MTWHRKTIEPLIMYILLLIVGILIIYPFLWLVGSSFKYTQEIFAGPHFIPRDPHLGGYIRGWEAAGNFTFTRFYVNTYRYVGLKVLATAFSCTITAYGFSRFDFVFRKQLYAILIATLLFPMTVILVPSYIMFVAIGWVNSYAPLIVPSLFAGDTFFVFLLYQFFRTLPRDMDEAAMIDGCGPVRRLGYIFVPLLKPAIATVVLFQFIFVGNDFLGPLIYIRSERLFPVSVALRMTMDTSSGVVAWENILAMSVVAIIPPLLVYIAAQRHFVEGITTSGLKG